MNALASLHSKVKPVFDALYNVILFICKIMLIVEVVLAVIMVAGRFIFNNQPPWCSELILTFMVYMSMMSAALALRRNAHIRMDVFDRFLPKKLLRVLDLLADVAIFAFSIMMITQGWIYATSTRATFTSLPFISRFWLFFAVPLAGVCIFIFEFEALIKHISEFSKKEETV